MSMIVDNRTPLLAERVRVFTSDFDAASKVEHSIANLLGLDRDTVADTRQVAKLALCASEMKRAGLSPDIIMATVAVALDCDEGDAWINGTSRLVSENASVEYERAKKVWRRNMASTFDRRTPKERRRDEHAEAHALLNAAATFDNVVLFEPRDRESESENQVDEGA